MPWWGWLITIAASLLVIWWIVVFVVFGLVVGKTHKEIQRQEQRFDNKWRRDKW